MLCEQESRAEFGQLIPTVSLSEQSRFMSLVHCFADTKRIFAPIHASTWTLCSWYVARLLSLANSISPPVFVDFSNVQSATVREFDDRLTRKTFGYATVDDYYRDASCHRFIPKVS